MSVLTNRVTTLRHEKLESVQATFPTADGETKLSIIIEQSSADFHDGEGMTRDGPPRMRINPSHGFAGYTRAESVWIQNMIPVLWDEWEKRVGARGGGSRDPHR